MKRILIAYDGSPGAEAAIADLRYAGLGKNAMAKVLCLADVWLPGDSTETDPGLTDQARIERTRARQHAMELMAAARQNATRGTEKVRSAFPDWHVEGEARADSPAWSILGTSREWAADLVALGSHGRSPLEKFFLGSISYKVAAEAECSVRISRPRSEKTDELRVIVALDGSDDSKAALDEVLSRTWPIKTRFKLLGVIDPKLKTAALQGDDPQSLEKLLSVQAERFKAAGLESEVRLLEGEAKAVILREQAHWNADSVFLGARGLHHRKRLYLGTTASAIASRAHCSVEIFRPRPLLAQN